MTPSETTPSETQIAIEATGLSVCYGRGEQRHVVFSGLDLTIGAGEIVGIQGPSGCGKSTLLRVLSTLERPTEGRLTLGRQHVTRMLRTSYVMPIDQGTAASLDPRWPVWRSITEPLMAKHRRPHPRSEQRRSIARAELDAVGLEQVGLETRPGELSGGQRQRVAILRALVAGPKVLVADEPTASLDVSVAAGILQLLARTADRGVTIVIASHDRASLQVLADRVLEMRAGRLVELPGERRSGQAGNAPVKGRYEVLSRP
jgi:peptide/nickel transport system ATP-binding protein